MERLLGILLAPLYLAVNGYILWRFLAWLAACAPALGRRPVRACLGLSYFLLCATPLAGFLLPAGPVQRAVKLAGNIWLGCLLYILLFLAAADLTALAVRRRKGRPATPQGKARARRLFAVWGGAVAAVIVAVSTYGAVHFGQIRTTYYTAQVPKACAAGDGLRVALASDLHLGASVGTRQLARMVRRVNEARPDVVVLAGDIFDNSYDDLDDPAGIRDLLASMESTYGVYACYGNHDVSERLLAGFTFGGAPPRVDPRMDALLAEAGVTVLQDESVLVDGAFYLVGRLDAKRPARGEAGRLPVARLTEGLDKTKPILLLDHQPRELAEDAAAGVDAALSGHVHDGQLFPVNLFVKLLWENPCGYRYKDGMHSFVTAGVGVWGPAMRVGTNAEVMVIDLRFTGAA